MNSSAVIDAVMEIMRAMAPTTNPPMELVVVQGSVKPGDAKTYATVWPLPRVQSRNAVDRAYGKEGIQIDFRAPTLMKAFALVDQVMPALLGLHVPVGDESVPFTAGLRPASGLWSKPMPPEPSTGQSVIQRVMVLLEIEEFRAPTPLAP